MIEQKIMNLLSMAQRANQVVSGEFAAQKALQEGHAKLLILAEDIAEETKKSYIALAEKYRVPFHYLLTREQLGQCIGKNFRAAAVLLDSGFSKAIEKWLKEKGKN